MRGIRLTSAALTLLCASYSGAASEEPAPSLRKRGATGQYWTAREPCEERTRPHHNCEEKWHTEELCNGTDPHLPKCNLIFKCEWDCPDESERAGNKFMCKKPVNKLQRMGHRQACRQMGKFHVPYKCRENGRVCCTVTNADVSGSDDVWGGCRKVGGGDGEGDRSTRDDAVDSVVLED